MGDIFDQMAEKWPSAVVARTEISRFTGGMMSAKYQSNLDSLGQGPKGRLTVGRKVGYPVDSLVEWLRDRATERGGKHAR